MDTVNPTWRTQSGLIKHFGQYLLHQKIKLCHWPCLVEGHFQKIFLFAFLDGSTPLVLCLWGGNKRWQSVCTVLLLLCEIEREKWRWCQKPALPFLFLFIACCDVLFLGASKCWELLWKRTKVKLNENEPSRSFKTFKASKTLNLSYSDLKSTKVCLVEVFWS